MNPRVVLWLAAMGFEPEVIIRRSGADVPQVTVNGERNLWTVHYTSWVSAQWKAWANSLGYTLGNEPWRAAMRDGHTSEEFDAFLEREVRS